MAKAVPPTRRTSVDSGGNHDMLSLSQNMKAQKMLQKMGDNSPEMERVELSVRLTKINNRNKRQIRIFLLTDKAVYNLKPNEYKSPKRRIPLSQISAVTVSSTSDEFVIHIPKEYDYRFESEMRDRILLVLKRIWYHFMGESNLLTVIQSDQSQLSKQTMDRKKSKRLSTAEKLARFKNTFGAAGAPLVVDKSYTYKDEIVIEWILLYWARVDCDGLIYLNADALFSVRQFILSLGAHFSDFEVKRLVGRGSFARVFEVKTRNPLLMATMTTTATTVTTDEATFALKVYNRKGLEQKKQIKHTQDERTVLAMMTEENRTRRDRRRETRHKSEKAILADLLKSNKKNRSAIPFFTELRFAFSDDYNLYFVLDFYSGGELFFHLKKKRRFTENETRHIAAQIGLGVGFLHSFHYIWRSGKPEDIVVDDNGYVAITDFGLCGPVCHSQTYTEARRTFCGTPEYLAPEIVNCNDQSYGVDHWSFGILIYEMCVGIPPFYSQNINEMYRKIIEAPLLFPPNLSEQCKHLLTSLLERQSNQRLGYHGGFTKILAHPWFQSIDWDALTTKTLTLPYRPNNKNNFDIAFTSDENAVTEILTEALHQNIESKRRQSKNKWPNFDYP